MIATTRAVAIARLDGNRKIMAPSMLTETTISATHTNETSATETSRPLQAAAAGRHHKWDGQRARRRRRRAFGFIRDAGYDDFGILESCKIRDKNGVIQSNFDSISQPNSKKEEVVASNSMQLSTKEEEDKVEAFKRRDCPNYITYGQLVATSQLILVILSIILQPIASTLASRVEPSNSNDRLQYLGGQQQQWELPSSLAVDSIYQKQRQQHQLHSQYLNHLRQQQQETMNGQHQGLDENQGANFRGSLVHLLPHMGAADLQQQASQQSPSYQWTSDLWPSASSNQQVEHAASGGPLEFAAPPPPNNKQHAASGIRQQVQSQQLTPASGSTTPTISRQLIAPPPFYEIGLAPTSAIQLELASNGDGPGTESHPAQQQQQQQQRLLDASQAVRSLQVGGGQQRQQQQQHPNQLGSIRNNNNNNLMLAESSNIDEQQLINALNQHHHQLNNHPLNHLPIHNGTARSLDHSQSGDNQHHNQQPRDAGELPQPSNKLEGDQNNNDDSSKSSNNGQESGTASQDQPAQQVDKAIEPRQRRRIFNRILKKAEWNHLFVELSKVFLRYFLDLALKDIIGKQSGAGSDSTTSRKKLDAQTELTDLLKDFVKTAISNI